MNDTENNQNNQTFRILWFRCITALLCVALICGTTLYCITNYCSQTVSSNTNSQSSVSNTTDEIYTVETDNGEIVENDEALEIEEETENIQSDSQEVTQAATNENDTKSATTVSEKAKIISEFNTAINKVKSNSKSITQNYFETSQVSTPEINNKVLQSVANSLINSNMGKSKQNLVYTTADEKKANFPIENQTVSSKLTEADVKTAESKTSNGITTLTITVLNDTSVNDTASNTHAAKAFIVPTKAKIVDGAGSAGMKFIKEDSIAVTYSNGKIIAKIDDKTGNVIYVNYYIEWKLSLSTTVGIDVSVSFGSENDFTINW